jgi:ribosomal protein S21
MPRRRSVVEEPEPSPEAGRLFLAEAAIKDAFALTAAKRPEWINGERGFWVVHVQYKGEIIEVKSGCFTYHRSSVHDEESEELYEYAHTAKSIIEELTHNLFSTEEQEAALRRFAKGIEKRFGPLLNQGKVREHVRKLQEKTARQQEVAWKEPSS